MDKKSNNKATDIPPDKEIDPDDVVHEEEIIPDSVDEQDIDDLVHSIKKPAIEANLEEQDIDDLMHEEADDEEITGLSRGNNKK